VLGRFALLCVVVYKDRLSPPIQLFHIFLFRPSTLVIAAEALLLLIRITELQSTATPFPLRVTRRLLGDLRYANERRSTLS
jgi:hypothetical protein